MMPNKWEIWLVDMSFEDSIESKIRPVLVIEVEDNLIVVGKMTTHEPRDNYQYEYAMIDWKGAGLHRPTTLRLSQIIKYEPTCFIKKLGHVQPVDQISISNMLKVLFPPKF